MRKLRLQLENLTVESFETDRAREFSGTVQGRQEDDAFPAASAPDPCLPDTYPTCPRRRTEYASCVAYCECTNGLRACIGLGGTTINS